MPKRDTLYAVLMTLAVLAICLAVSDLVWGLDCSYKPPCPVGTTPQESVSCDACCADGYAITKATDTDCCPIGSWLAVDTPTMKVCCANGTILKSDGMCCVANEADPCNCQAGWHLVGAFSCCPDGKFISADNPECCVTVQGANCCQTYQDYRTDANACVPKKATGIVVR